MIGLVKSLDVHGCDKEIVHEKLEYALYETGELQELHDLLAGDGFDREANPHDYWNKFDELQKHRIKELYAVCADRAWLGEADGKTMADVFLLDLIRSLPNLRHLSLNYLFSNEEEDHPFTSPFLWGDIDATTGRLKSLTSVK